jgi:hypothetical protein
MLIVYEVGYHYNNISEEMDNIPPEWQFLLELMPEELDNLLYGKYTKKV